MCYFVISGIVAYEGSSTDIPILEFWAGNIFREFPNYSKVLCASFLGESNVSGWVLLINKV